MFVSDNLLKTAQLYFHEQLQGLYSQMACKQMWQQILEKRFAWTPTDLLLKQQERLSESDLLYIRSIVKRLQTKEPFQYILGETYFADMLLKTDARALIPRPETEELVALVKAQGLSYSKIIDFCTGSACIALALKKAYPTAVVSAIDLSEAAIELAQENARLNQLELQLEVQDLFEWASTTSYDMMISNPPYIPQKEAALIKENVLAHEPHMALFVSDQNPLLFYEQLARLALSNLQSKGIIALEVHENLAQQTLALFDKKYFTRCEIHRDLQGKERMILAQKA